MLLDLLQKDNLTLEDAVELLSVDTKSPAFYELLGRANALSRSEYQGKGYIFAQIGINAGKCSGNCKFCSLAKDYFAVPAESEQSLSDILNTVKNLDTEKLQALFLMTTADYNGEKFLEIGRAVREILPQKVDLVANVGDFGLSYAQKLKEAGFSGVYHIVRLREGIDTDLPVERRVATLDAIRDGGLQLYYCVEPIGSEHSYEEIATEMLRAREYQVDVMAVMRRVNVPGTPLSQHPPITELELTKIAAVARLVTRPKISMNVHEPMMMPLLAGVNQFYAEIGINPRDTGENTENRRGFSVSRVEQMLNEGEYYL